MRLKMKIREISALLNKLAPYKTAYDFDNVGLLLGDGERSVSKMMLSLDAAPEVVEQAITANVQLLITHHPLIFKAVKNITTDNPNGRMILRLIENKIALIALHTNLDIARDGVNDMLANLAGLDEVYTVADNCQKEFVKLSLFAPVTHSKHIIDLLDSLQIEIFSNYQSCSFTTTGTGRFKPLNGANPFVGAVQELCSLAEDKIEFVLPRVSVEEVIGKVKVIHPYEQMAYDVTVVDSPCLSHGILRIGKLPISITASEFAAQLKQNMGLDYVLLNNPDKQIVTVAVCGGTGAAFIEAAKRAGADALLTGDVKYHEAQNAKYLDLALIAIGHQQSEQPIMKLLTNNLSKQAALKDIQIILAKQDKILHCV